MSSFLLNTPPRSSSASDAARDAVTPSPRTTNQYSSQTNTTVGIPISDTRVEELAKKVEETCERVCRDAGIPAMRNDPTSAAALVPLRFKEIVKEYLTSPRMAQSEDKDRRRRECVRYVEMVREGRGGEMAKEEREERELERVRQHLEITKRHNEELSQKYISVSEKVEEIFHLKAEISKLTFERASLKAENVELQKTLLDQETSFSFSLRGFQSETMERELIIGRLEEQLKQNQIRYTELELDMSTRHTLTERRHLELNSEIIQLREEVRRRLEETETTRTAGREEVVRLKNNIEDLKKESDEMMAEVKMRSKKELEKVKALANEKEMTHLAHLRNAQERIEREEKRSQELILIKEHLQVQLKEGEAANEELSKKVQSLSLSLSDIRGRMTETERRRNAEVQKAKEEVIESRKKHKEEMKREKARGEETMREKLKEMEKIASQREAEAEKLQQMLRQEMESLKLHHSSEEKKLSNRTTEMKAQMERETREKERLARELQTTRETLAKQNSLIEEGKQQRSVLNSTIASLAQEKADILRGKVALEVRLQTITDETESQKKKLLMMIEERTQLQDTVNEYEKRVFLTELNKSISSSSTSRNISGKVSTSFIASLKLTIRSLLPRASSERRNQILKDCEPLFDILSMLTEKENQVRTQLNEMCSEYEIRLRTDKEEHSRQTEALKKEQSDERERCKKEMEELRKSHQHQMKSQAQIQLEKERRTEAEMEKKKEEWHQEKDTLQTQMSLERKKFTKEKQRMVDLLKRDSERLASTLHRVKELEKEREQLLDRQSVLVTCKEGLTVTVSSFEQINSELQFSLASKSRELEETLENLHDKESELTKLRESVLKLLKERKEETEELQRRLTESQIECERLRNKKDGMESVLIATKDNCTSLEGELQVIKNELFSCKFELESATVKLDESKTKYQNLLATMEHILISDEHPKDGGGLGSADALEEALVRLQNERNQLRERVLSDANNLRQLRTKLDSTVKERDEALNGVESLQEKMETLQKKLDHRSHICLVAEEETRSYNKKFESLSIEHNGLKQTASELEIRMKSLKVQNGATEEKCGTLEDELARSVKASKNRADELLKLTHSVTVLESSQLAKEREIAELESRLRSSQRGALENELTLKNSERKIALHEQKLAQYEQQQLREESTKQELHSRVTHLKSQLTEIKERAKNLRQDLVISETERETLRGDLHGLSLCLQMTTKDKEKLSQSQEREIERLREEAGRRLLENSTLKLGIVRSSSSQLLMEESSVHVQQSHRSLLRIPVQRPSTSPRPSPNLFNPPPPPPTSSSTPRPPRRNTTSSD